MIKIVYFTDRLPHMTHADFVERWKQHGALAMRYPAFFDPVVNYLQSDGLDAPEVAGRGAYEGVGELCYGTIGGCVASMTSSDLAQTITPDGDLTFGKNRWKCVAADSKVIRHGNDGPYKLYLLIAPKEGAATSRWDEQNDTQAILASTPGRVAIATPAQTGLPLDAFDALLEISGESADVLRAAGGKLAQRFADADREVTTVMTKPRVILADRA